jgi:hypothetical protein
MGLSCVEVVVAKQPTHNTGDRPMRKSTKPISALRQRMLDDQGKRTINSDSI